MFPDSIVIEENILCFGFLQKMKETAECIPYITKIITDKNDLTKKYDIKTMVSLNPIMVDGTGMCGGCRAIVDNKTVFVCVDGPEFDAHKVDFETLARRNRTYGVFEKEAVDHFCNIDKEFQNGLSKNKAAIAG